MNTSGKGLVLGVDGGGTSTVAWLAATGGTVLGRGKAGPSNAKAVGNDAARSALSLAIEAAFAEAGRPPCPVDVACMGLAGFGRPEDRKTLAQWNEGSGWARRLLTVTDGDLVVAAGTPEGWGVGVIAGTGSIAVGRAEDGTKARAGGWGHLIGDEGSAYAVVLGARGDFWRSDPRESALATRWVRFVSPRASASYRLTSDFALQASVSRAYRTPTDSCTARGPPWRGPARPGSPRSSNVQ